MRSQLDRLDKSFQELTNKKVELEADIKNQDEVISQLQEINKQQERRIQVYKEDIYKLRVKTTAKKAEMENLQTSTTLSVMTKFGIALAVVVLLLTLLKM